MRFRYFDAEGTEVRVSTVDALRFRIQTSAVTPETLLYDAAIGQWAPAHRHTVFQFILEEDEDLLPEATRARRRGGPLPLAGPRAGAGSPPETGSGPASSDGGAGPHPPDPPDDDPLFPRSDQRREAPSADAGGILLLNDEPEVVSPSTPRSRRSPAEAKRGSGPKEKPRSKSEEDRAAANSLGFPILDLKAEASPPAPPRNPVPPTSPSSETPPAPAPASVAPPKAGNTVRLRRARSSTGSTATPQSRASVTRASSRRRKKRRRLVSRRTLTWTGAVALLVGAPLFLFLRGGGLEEGGAAYAVVGGLSDLMESVREFAIDGAVQPLQEPSSATPPAPEPAFTAVTSPGGRDPSGGDGGRLAADAFPALSAEVAAAASGDLERAMAELRASLEVPPGPPDIWLRGRYLAGADGYPQVRQYWLGFSAYVVSMHEIEEDLYSGFVQNRVLGMRLDTADAARLSAETMERYEESSRIRDRAYRDLAELAAHALALHDTLAHRSDLISYEPFDSGRLSRDPVIEAVADDPALAQHIWTRLDRIFDLLEGVQGLRPVTTSQLQEALIGGLGRAPDPDG